MYFTIKLLKLLVRVLLLPIRLIALPFKYVRQRTNESTDESAPQPAPNEQAQAHDQSTPTETDDHRSETGHSGGSATGSARGRQSDGIRYHDLAGWILYALAAMQIVHVGILYRIRDHLYAHAADPIWILYWIPMYGGSQISSYYEPLSFLFATPIGDVLYLTFGYPSAYLPVMVVLSILYAAIFAYLGRQLLDGRPTESLQRGAVAFFALNAVLYVFVPFFRTRAIQFNLPVSSFYTEGLTIPLIIFYLVLMGGLGLLVRRHTGTQTHRAAKGATRSDTARPARSRSNPGTGSAVERTNNSATASATSQPTETARTAERTPPRPRDQTDTPTPPSPVSATDEVPRDTAKEGRQNESSEHTQRHASDRNAVSTAEAEPKPEPASSEETAPESASASGSSAPVAQSPSSPETEAEMEATTASAEAGESQATILDLLDQLAEADERASEIAERILSRAESDPTAIEPHTERLVDIFERTPDPATRETLVRTFSCLDAPAAADALQDAQLDSNVQVSKLAIRLSSQ